MFSLTGTSTSENFDSLATSGTTNPQSSAIFDNGWSFLEGGNNANTTYSAGTGSSSTGDTYSFGVAGTNAASDRAFGMLQSGSLTSILGFQFTNNTGSTITSLAVNYFGEEWRRAAAADTLNFSYAIGNVALNGSGFTGVTGLNFTTPVTGSATALDGNATANRTSLSSTISGLSIAAGQTVTFRWVDPTGTSSAGMAIDDFSLLATLGGTSLAPRNLVWDADVATAGPQDGPGTWDAANTNWYDGSTNVTFDTTRPDNATFGTGSGAGASYTVSLGANITAGTLTFAASSPTYIITDGGVGNTLTLNGGITANTSAAISAPIAPGAAQTWTAAGGQTLTASGTVSGAFALSLGGSGTIVLGGTNTYSGGTSITGGTVQISNDANLGTGNVSIGGNATLAATADVTSTKSVTLTSGGATIDDGGHAVTFSGGIVPGGVAFTKADTGTVTLSNMPSGTFGTLAVNGGTLALSGGTSTTSPYSTTVTLASTGSSVAAGAVLALGTTAVGNALRLSVPGPVTGGGEIDLATGGAIVSTSTTATIAPTVRTVGVAGATYPTVYLGANSGDTLTLANGITGTAGVTFASGFPAGITSGTGTVALNGASSYTGDTIIALQVGGATGTVKLGVDDALPTATNLSFVSGAGALDLAGHSQTVASLTSTGATAPAGVMNSSKTTASTLTIGGSSTTIYNAPIGSSQSNGNIALVLAAGHTGKLTLTGTNVYTGGTTVRGGTLVAGAASATGTGPVLVGVGGTLGGTATVSSSITVNGIVTGGTGATSADGTGTLTTTGNEVWNGTGDSTTNGYYTKIGPNGSANDQLVMSGLSIDGTNGAFSVVLQNTSSGTVLTAGTQLVLAINNDLTLAQASVFANAIGSSLTLVTNGFSAGDGSALTLAEIDTASGEDLVLDVGTVAAPEPASVLLMATAITPLVLGRRRKRRSFKGTLSI